MVVDGDDQDHAVTRPDGPHADAAGFCAAEYPQLVRALSLYVGDADLAEELAQEALLRACRRWGKVSQLESPGGWTWRVSVNLANSHFRRRQAARRARQRLDRATAHFDSDGADAVAVRQAVASLPARQCSALVLRHVLDLSAPDTAVRMGISADAVRSLTKRATATLRAQLGEHTPLPSREAPDA